MSNFLCIFNRSEYIALLVSVVAICINVYISYKNRKHALAKEEYFKLQQVVEKIIAKLIILSTHQQKLLTYIKLIHETTTKGGIFIDSNDTFNRGAFERNGEEITAMIDIYFSEMGEEWNECLAKISDLYTHVFKLSKKFENQEIIEWKQEIETFNAFSLALGTKPKQMADKLKQKLNEYKSQSGLGVTTASKIFGFYNKPNKTNIFHIGIWGLAVSAFGALISAISLTKSDGRVTSNFLGIDYHIAVISDY